MKLILLILITSICFSACQNTPQTIKINQKLLEKKSLEQHNEIKNLPLFQILGKDMVPSSWGMNPNQKYYLIKKIPHNECHLIIYLVNDADNESRHIGIGATFNNNLIFNYPTAYYDYENAKGESILNYSEDRYYLTINDNNRLSRKIDLTDELNHLKERYKGK